MRDHITRDSTTQQPRGFNKDNICWPFNRGKCNDPGCVKEHQCSYCGKWGHGMHVCRKKKSNLGNKSENNDNRTGPPNKPDHSN